MSDRQNANRSTSTNSGDKTNVVKGNLSTSSSGLSLSRLPYMNKFLDIENSNRNNSNNPSIDHARRSSTCTVHKLLKLSLQQEQKKVSGGNTASYLDPGPDNNNNSTSPSSQSTVQDELLTSPTSTPPSRQSSTDALNVEAKENISEMVLSVRDLSKNLSNVSMHLEFHNIMLVSKITDSSLVPVTRDFALWLLGTVAPTGSLNIYVQDILRTHEKFEYNRLKEQWPELMDRLGFWTSDGSENGNKYDLVVALGGDGTVLYTSWMFQHVVPPVLCFSMGSLGFMTEFDYGQRKEIISSILENGVTCSLRMRFECTVMRAQSRDNKSEHELEDEIEQVSKTGKYKNHKVEKTFSILNDVVVDRGPNPTMTSTVLFGDNQFLTAIEADGVVIATPSGSTAYSLSAGGSLVHPDIPGILISPICPHTLSFRPLVLPDSLVITVGVPYDARETAWCSFDGKSRVELYRGDLLCVTASRYPFPMIHNGNTSSSWFTRLSKTLHWNERRRQKPLA